MGSPKKAGRSPRPASAGDIADCDTDGDAIIANVARALRPRGRLVAELGNYQCVNTVLIALIDEIEHRGYDGRGANPWHFLNVEDYGARLSFEARLRQ